MVYQRVDPAGVDKMRMLLAEAGYPEAVVTWQESDPVVSVVTRSTTLPGYLVPDEVVDRAFDILAGRAQ